MKSYMEWKKGGILENDLIMRMVYIGVTCLIIELSLLCLFCTFFELYPAQGDSMEPTILNGDYLLVSSYHRGEIKSGDIIVYRSPLTSPDGSHPLIGHRVLEIENGYLHAQGDNRVNEDPFDIPFTSIEGKVFVVVPGIVMTLLYSDFGFLLPSIFTAGFMSLYYNKVQKSRTISNELVNSPLLSKN